MVTREEEVDHTRTLVGWYTSTPKEALTSLTSLGSTGTVHRSVRLSVFRLEGVPGVRESTRHLSYHSRFVSKGVGKHKERGKQFYKRKRGDTQDTEENCNFIQTLPEKRRDSCRLRTPLCCLLSGEGSERSHTRPRRPGTMTTSLWMWACGEEGVVLFGSPTAVYIRRRLSADPFRPTLLGTFRLQVPSVYTGPTFLLALPSFTGVRGVCERPLQSRKEKR